MREEDKLLPYKSEEPQQKPARSIARKTESDLAPRGASGRPRFDSNKQPLSKKSMTYDDYIKAVKNNEKLIDLDDTPTLGESIRETMGPIMARLKKRLVNLLRIMLQGLKSFYRAIVSRLPGLKNLAVRRSSAALGLSSKKLSGVKLIGSGKHKTRFLAAASALSVIIFIVMIVKALPGGSNNTDQVDGQVSGAVSTGSEREPQAFPVLSSDTVNEDQGIVFDASRGVASFRDVVGGYTVTISQQPLTDDQKRDENTALSEVATNLLAQGSFRGSKGQVYYTTTLDETPGSVQVVIFTHKGLLVFIRTPGVLIDSAVWEVYIDSLR